MKLYKGARDPSVLAPGGTPARVHDLKHDGSCEDWCHACVPLRAPNINPPRRWQVWNLERTLLIREVFGADEVDAAREAVVGEVLGLPGAPHPGFSVREVGPWRPVKL